MANFDEEFKKLIFVEGGYVNDKDDSGGETYLGISRKNNPNWKGWRIIDDIKKINVNNITNKLKQNDTLTKYVKEIYKEKYWDTIYLDEVPSQKIAHQIFDTAVNMGVSKAIKLAEHIMQMTITGKFSEELLYNLKHYGQKY